MRGRNATKEKRIRIFLDLKFILAINIKQNAKLLKAIVIYFIEQ